MVKDKNYYSDWIKFLDENNESVEWFVKITDTSNLITFETEGGNEISIPSHRVLKIKKRGEKA